MSEVASPFTSLGVCKSFLCVAGAFAVAALTFLGAPAEAQSSVTAKWTRVVTGGFPQYADVVAADSAGNVIAGGVWGDQSFAIKYDANGNVVWRNWLEGPKVLRGQVMAVAVDAANDVFILSNLQIDPTPSLEPDVALSKYNAAGVRQWVRFAASLQVGYVGVALAVTPEGEVYTLMDAGDIQTTKYDVNGDEVWARTQKVTGDLVYNNLTTGIAIRLDAQGNVYAATDNGDNGEIFRYDANGNLLNTIGVGKLGVIRAYRVDAAGNSYVLGGGPLLGPGNEDRIVAKFSAGGTLEWQNDLGPQLNTPIEGGSTLVDTLKDIGVDGAGDVYILQDLPSVPATPSGVDMATTKFNAGGTEEWTSRFNGSADHSAPNVSIALAVDSAGDVYVTGEGAPAGSKNGQTATIKYSSTGQQLWVQFLTNPQNPVSPVGIALGTGGQVFVESQTASEDLYTTDYGQN